MGSDEQATELKKVEENEASRSWTGGRLALRLNKPARFRGTSANKPAAPATSAEPPRGLRLIRLLAGVGLLFAAWGCLMLAALAFERVNLGLRLHALFPHALISLGEVAAGVWLIFIALVCVVAGAFCLSLAITSHDW